MKAEQQSFFLRYHLFQYYQRFFQNWVPEMSVTPCNSNFISFTFYLVSSLLLQFATRTVAQMATKSLERSPAVGDFYGTGIEIWAGFGPVRQLLRPVLSCFHGQKFFFVPENMKKLSSKVAYNQSDQTLILVLPIGPDLNSCSIKISHYETSL